MPPKQIRLNALDMYCMGCTPGIWTHPADETHRKLTLGYWTDMAQTLERGLFESIFIADIFGVYDVYGGNADAAFRHAVEFPVYDPMVLVPAMAMVTENLGFGITGTLSYEPPFSFARRCSTLDHLTGGRFAWNIVTGYLASAARAFGKPDQLPHDERYAMAEEFMGIVYRLWEESWDADAVVRDKQANRFADPDKIRSVSHQGTYFQVEARHLCEPSPQRTPVLFQAGASKRGRAFAAKHAECVFISGLTRPMVAEIVKDIRQQAASFGRDPDSVLIYTAFSAVTGPDEKAAKERYEDYRRHVNLEGTLALFGGYSGIDFSGVDLDLPLHYVESNAIQTFVEGFTSAAPEREWTLREIGEFLGIGGFAPIAVGDPTSLADEMALWMDETGIDGFNLIYSVSPQDVNDFVDLVIPELQRRGLYRTTYPEGETMREKLYGSTQRSLRADHPGAKYRSSVSGGEERNT
ncbi:MAG: LLM class flavin-dependent oxidoreductase [Verrucomicrobiae bacterium]|nr:LLM class flavin-dependent oxidoreductase [Verrucomicrobiae bacterium]